MSNDLSNSTDIRDAVCLIQEFVANQSKEEFIANQMLQSAVLHQLMIIGEAAKRLSVEFR